MTKKWTREQKRPPGHPIAETIDIYADQRVTAVPERDPRILRRVQSTLAVTALETDDPEGWLRDSLDALGLRYPITVRRLRPEICGAYKGTLRGYNLHLRNYTRVCASCEVVRQEALAAKTALRGVPEGADIKWSI